MNIDTLCLSPNLCNSRLNFGQKGLSWLFGLVTRFLCKKDVHRCAAFHYFRLRGGNRGIMYRKLGGIKQQMVIWIQYHCILDSFISLSESPTSSKLVIVGDVAAIVYFYFGYLSTGSLLFDFCLGPSSSALVYLKIRLKTRCQFKCWIVINSAHAWLKMCWQDTLYYKKQSNGPRRLLS